MDLQLHERVILVVGVTGLIGSAVVDLLRGRGGDPRAGLGAIEAKAMTVLRVANAVVPTLTEAGFGRVVGVSGQNALLTGNLTGSVRNAALIIAAKNLADASAGTGEAIAVGHRVRGVTAL